MAATNPLRSIRPDSESPASRYYFDISDGTLIRDEIGRVIDTPLALRREALRILTALAAEEADDANECSLHLTVRDASGAPRLAVRMVCQVAEP